MEVKKIEVNKLKFADYNPRIKLKQGDSEYEKLKRSIETYGYIEPIIYNEKTGNIVGGNQRLQVLIDLGCTEVDCVIVNLSLNDEKSLNIALNKISGDWDIKKLEDLLNELKVNDYDLTLTGFDSHELNELLYSDIIFENIEEKLPEIDSENIITKTGDIWQLGEHRLLCGDCTDAVLMDTFLESNMIDLLITDPPYGVNYEGARQKRKTIKNDNLKEKEFNELLSKSFWVAARNLRKGAAFYIWYAALQENVFREAITKKLGDIRQTLIWAKNHFVLGRQDYQWAHEACFYGWTEGKRYFINRKQDTLLSKSLDLEAMSKEELIALISPLTVFSENKPMASAEHPTMKPLSIIGQLIHNSSKQKEKVLDIFAGSGTTLIACEKLDRICYTVEIEPYYCDVIAKRFNSIYPDKAILLNRKKIEKF